MACLFKTETGHTVLSIRRLSFSEQFPAYARVDLIRVLHLVNDTPDSVCLEFTFQIFVNDERIVHFSTGCPPYVLIVFVWCQSYCFHCARGLCDSWVVLSFFCSPAATIVPAGLVDTIMLSVSQADCHSLLAGHGIGEDVLCLGEQRCLILVADGVVADGQLLHVGIPGDGCCLCCR